MIRTAVLGASGYVGGELLRLMAAHPELAPAKLFGDSKAGQKLGAVHPHLTAAYPDALVEKFEERALENVDLVFAALPHGHSQRLASTILHKGIPFVDLGADFQFSPQFSLRFSALFSGSDYFFRNSGDAFGLSLAWRPPGLVRR